MIQTIKKITLDVYKPNLFKLIVAKQGDSNSRFIKATIVNDGRKIDIPITATALINALRVDGEAKSFSCEVNADGTVTAPLTYWMLEIGGVVECDISVIGADNTRLTTSKFFVEVETVSCPDGEISSDENYGILVQLIEDVKEVQATGIPGKEGLSAYEVAVKNGFEGTEAEWLESLSGKSPVKGVDYFTSEDKAEFVTEVIRVLPIWNGGEY